MGNGVQTLSELKTPPKFPSIPMTVSSCHFYSLPPYPLKSNHRSAFVTTDQPAFSRVLYKLNLIVCTIYSLASFTQNNSFDYYRYCFDYP